MIFTSDNGGLGGYRDAGLEGGAEVTSNAPLRGGKGMLEEGGIRVPLLVSWPGHTAPGSLCPELVTTVDFYPSLLAAAGVPLDGTSLLDGLDLTPLWRGTVNRLAARDLVWHMPVYLECSAELGTWRCTPSAAIRRGRWKLIERFETGAAELYDLVEDPGEATDLAEKRQDLTRELRSALERWRSETQAAMPREEPLR
ncbi:MAG: sulfatase-like hydrolase/transferase [Planctomycetes bacterium]|nr:sulfatase-like hydrolase/transferase [Planctomycetota bacterium]